MLVIHLPQHFSPTVSIWWDGASVSLPLRILSAGVEEPNALVTIGTGADQDPNIRATVAELYDKMVASSQNPCRQPRL